MTRGRGRRDASLVRQYVLTGGRTEPTRNHFEHLTLVMLTPSSMLRTCLSPEQCQVLDLCLPGALSVAEIGAHLGLPTSVLRILLADLMDSGHITSRVPIPAAVRHERSLLERVLSGLRNL